MYDDTGHPGAPGTTSATPSTVDAESRRLVEILSSPICYIDRDERFRFANRGYESWFHLKPGQVIGRSIREVMGEKAYAAVRPRIRQTLAGEVVELDTDVKCANGTRRQVVARHVPDMDAEGEIHGFYCLIQERDLQQRTASRLREAAERRARIEQEERRRLAEELHADLGQRLALIALRLRALEDAPEPVRAAQLREIGNIASDACRRLASLGFRVYPTLLYDVGVVAATRWLAEEFASTGLKVHVEESEACRIARLGDEERTTLYRAVRELLDNVACHAGTDEAWVRFGCPGDRVRVEVEDTGCGIKPEAEFGGYGLLRLGEEIHRLGGEVTLSSGSGRTTVRVELPLSHEDVAT